LINVGRGPVVSESALVRALEEKLIRGAVLDVFEEEPLPKDSNLWELPNVLITPHNSAYSFPEDIVNIFAENYRLFVDGKPHLPASYHCHHSFRSSELLYYHNS
jgi:phosphoglycerate dehydrogenase-like enzyme